MLRRCVVVGFGLYSCLALTVVVVVVVVADPSFSTLLNSNLLAFPLLTVDVGAPAPHSAVMSKIETLNSRTPVRGLIVVTKIVHPFLVCAVVHLSCNVTQRVVDFRFPMPISIVRVHLVVGPIFMPLVMSMRSLNLVAPPRATHPQIPSVARLSSHFVLDASDFSAASSVLVNKICWISLSFMVLTEPSDFNAANSVFVEKVCWISLSFNCMDLLSSPSLLSLAFVITEPSDFMSAANCVLVEQIC